MIPPPVPNSSLNRIPATSDEPIPMRTVSPHDIGSGPGRARRPSPPTIPPQTTKKAIKRISSMAALLTGRDSAPARPTAPLGDEQVDAAEDQQREEKSGEGAEDGPEDEPDHHPADDPDADGLGDRPPLLAGEDRPQSHPEERTLDEQPEHEAEH